MKSFSKKFIIASVTLIIAGTISWAFYNLIYKGSEDILNKFGINNSYFQNTLIIIIGIIFLILVGWETKKIWSNILGK